MTNINSASKHFFQIILSIWVWISAFTVMSFSVCSLALYRMTRFKGFQLITFKLFRLVPYLTLSQIRVLYHPDYDPKRTSIYCQNHVSILDGFIGSLAIRNKFCGIMHKWQFNIPIYGWLMRLGEGISIEQNKRLRFKNLEHSIRERAKHNMSILAFPEGERTRNGKLCDFKSGIFIAAGSAGIPIVPIAVQGIFEVNQAESLLFSPGIINIFVGPQFETKGLSKDQLIELASKIKDFMLSYIK